MLKIGVLFLTLGVSLAHVRNQTNDPMCKSDPPSEVIPDECCNFPDLFSDNVVEECENKHGVNSTRKNSDDYDALEDLCVVECVFNTTGMNYNGKLDKNKVFNYLMNATKSETVWQPLLNKTIQHCFDSMSDENIKSYVSETKDEMKEKGVTSMKSCSAYSGFLLDCIYFEFFIDCPTNKSTTSDNCKKLFDYTKKCDDW